MSQSHDIEPEENRFEQRLTARINRYSNLRAAERALSPRFAPATGGPRPASAAAC
ncbi:MAG: hypothetical protein MJE66_11820 [Proteobacteria bacterium]|nr:hypothetical protein [Pseudomonadota bacterium]